MKAYIVTRDYGSVSDIVFADSPGKARYIALCRDGFEEETFTSLRVNRLPQLDGMENEEPKDNPWLNDKIRTILVKDYGWVCNEPNVYEHCSECCVKEHCGCWEQEDNE